MMIFYNNLLIIAKNVLLLIFFLSLPFSVIGQCWEICDTTLQYRYNDVFFIDDIIGWRVGHFGDFEVENGVIEFSSDGGKNWHEQYNESLYSLTAVSFISSQVGWVTGQDASTILHTIDGGNTWIQQNTGLSGGSLSGLLSVQFTDTLNGWAVGYGGVGSQGIIIYTNDGGSTWIREGSDIESTLLQDLHFVNNQIGWTVGEAGRIWYTTDGGLTWSRQTSGIETFYDLYSVYFINNQVGWIAGWVRDEDGEGLIIHTRDGGLTWTRQNSNTTSVLTSIHFIDDQTGWIAGGDGVIIHTQDGGLTWTTQDSNSDTQLSLHLNSSQLGWAVGSNGTILRYQDSAPNCDISLNNPLIGSTNNVLQPELFWSIPTGCPTGYSITLGTSSGSEDILAATDLGNTTTYTPEEPLPAGSTIYVSIRPYNSAGMAEDCAEFSFMTEGESCRMRDSLALVALYEATDGMNWTRAWILNEAIDSWDGVILGEEGCVTKLYLSSRNLSGSIPNELTNLTELTELGLDGNQLSGNIPENIGELNNLKFLFLSNNRLEGKIPSTIGQITNLLELVLNDNNLSDSIPKEFGSLTNLQRILLNDNNLIGGIPKEIGQMISLQQIVLSNNNLTNKIPKELGQLTNLVQLILRNNQLEDSIPSELRQLKNLSTIQLQNNRLTGSIPSALSELTDLVDLRLHNNQLNDNIPPALGELDNLVHLYLHDNQLSGSIPVELGNLSKIERISLSHNKFEGCMPESLLQLCSLSQQEYNDNGTFNNSGYNFANNPLLPWQGDFSRFCAGESQIGAPCDDGNPNTENDIITTDCGCQGCTPTEINLNEKICMGDTYIIEDQTFSTTGDYTVSLQSTSGCDSTINLTLEVLDFLTSDTTVSICVGDSYVFNGESYSESGNYSADLISFHGCDSTANLQLQVIDIQQQTQTTQICTNQTYNFNGRLLTESGTYHDTLHTANQCDSIITELTLAVAETLSTDLTETICAGESYPFGNASYTTNGIYTDTLSSAAGCDSIVTLDLRVADAFMTELTETICPGKSYQLGAETYTSTGNYEQRFTTANGCDSILQLQLTVVDPLTFGAATAGEDTGLCGEYQYTLQSNLPANTTGEWTSPTGVIFENQLSPITTVYDLPPGETQVVWTLSTADCPAYSADTLRLFVEEAIPVAEPDDYRLAFSEKSLTASLIENDSGLPADWSIELLSAPAAGKLELQTGGSFIYTLKNIAQRDRFTYRLYATHCPELADTAEVNFLITDLPTTGATDGFSPDGDGINDEFVIPELDVAPEEYPDNELIVFNRWGQLVYQAAPYTNSWDGTLMDSSKPLPAGTYYYIVRLNVGEGEIRYGQVTILR